LCGKFTQKRDNRLEALADASGDSPIETVTPIRFADVVALDREGARKIVRMRWGFVPREAPDVRDAKPHIHARAESIDAKPTFALPPPGAAACFSFRASTKVRRSRPRKRCSTC